MHKTYSAVELRVLRHPFFNAGHTDQDQPSVTAIELVAQELQAGHGKAFGFVNDYQLYQAKRC